MYDGACRGNPGLAAAGAVLTTEAGAEVNRLSSLAETNSCCQARVL